MPSKSTLERSTIDGERFKPFKQFTDYWKKLMGKGYCPKNVIETDDQGDKEKE